MKLQFNGAPVSEREYVMLKFGLKDPTYARQPIELPNMDRDDLARLFKELGYKKGAELGVETGKYSEVLLKANPDLTLYCVDAWQAYRGYREHVTQAKVDGLMATAMERLKPFGDRVKFIRKFTNDAAKDFPAKSLDFVYIDANHTLPFVVQDLCNWERVVRHGGIISGHDYCRRADNGYQVHVVEAVHAYTSAYHVAPWFVVGSKDVVLGEKRDRPRSFFWVKP